MPSAVFARPSGSRTCSLTARRSILCVWNGLSSEHSGDATMETTLLPAAPLLIAFVIASLVLAIVPGPGVLYIVTRSLVQGRRSGLTSVAGVALGNLGNAIGASIGLAALFAVSALAFP